MSNSFFSERLNYSGASDFVNGENSTIEYVYENGNLVKDRNKGLNFSYDLLGHPLKVWSDDGKNIIEYVYAADGRKLQTRHSKKSGSATVRDFRGALEVVNGYIDRINFQGGFYSYDWIDDYYSRNYYIQDYQDNIRMTVSSDDWGGIVSEYTTSVTDYYPYGNPHRGGSDYKYSGKYLDRTYGLDLYDFEARQQDPKLGCFTSIDPLAEKYYWISPYVYCAGDPVNCIDPDGRKVTFANDYMKEKFNEARDYAKSIGASEYIDKIYESEDFVVDIRMPLSLGENGYINKKETFSQGNWNEGIIYWDPTIAIETNTGYVMSPVEGLNHEAIHAVDDLAGGEEGHEKHKEKLDHKDPIWKNQSEKETCKIENRFARKMGKLGGKHQSTRTQYKVAEKKYYKEESVDSSSTENPIKL